MSEDAPGEEVRRIPRPSRRTFLVGAGGVAALLAGLDAIAPSEGVPGFSSDDLVDGVPDFTFDVVRADDALVLTFKLFNFAIDTMNFDQPLLVPAGGDLPYIIIEFPTQAIGEETTLLTTQLTDPTYNPPQFPIGTDANGYRAHAFATGQPTRLVFAWFATGDSGIRPSLESDAHWPGLLSWLGLTPSVTSGITSPSYSGPDDHQTSIGAPFGLALSPEDGMHWLHSETPVTLGGRTELWHTRMGTFPPDVDTGPASALREYPDVTPQVKAVWSDGFDRTAESIPSDTGTAQLPLSANDRRAIVRLTSDQITGPANNRYVPKPVDVHRLMLSSGGAWLDLTGSWDPPDGIDLSGPPPNPNDHPQAPGINLSSWTHRSTQGRDHHVVVTYLGYLLPFGHPAVLVKKTVRRFETAPTGSPVANLRSELYVIVSGHEKTYGDGSATQFQGDDGRDFPFRRVRINTKVTPNLTLQRIGNPVASGVAFCIANGEPFMFDVSAWDWEGNKIDFQLPMALVTRTAAVSEDGANGTVYGSPLDFGNEGGGMANIRFAYDFQIANNDPLRQADMHGKPIALAASLKPGDTTVRVDSMSFSVVAPTAAGDGIDFGSINQPRANPAMTFAMAKIPAVQAVSPTGVSKVFYDPHFIADSFVGPGASNPVDKYSVFLTVVDQPLNFTGGDGAHPGVITPNLGVNAISRNRGVVGGPNGADNYRNQEFDPSDYFKLAKLLGGLDLASILVSLVGSDDKPNLPVMNTVTDYPTTPLGLPDTSKAPARITTLSWSPALKSFPITGDPHDPNAEENSLFIAHNPAGDAAKMSLQAKVVVSADPTVPATSDVTGSLRDFTLQLFGGVPFLILDFQEFSFHSRNGAKPTVTPTITNVTFGGPLTFVNALKDLLSSGDDGNGITITPTSVTASVTLAIPSVGIGVLSLSNLSFTAAVDIPFIDAPARVRFSFCTRDKPFLLSVMIFSGGGFVGLALGTDGMEMLEMSFEFGAHVSIDLVVASGALEIMAGIYLKLSEDHTVTPATQSTELTGFVKAHGELNVGPVGISITFELSLTFLDDNGKKSVFGQVQVHVEVHVLVFSGTISFTAKKQFSGGGDPTFADMLTEDQFRNDYALAFA